MKKICKQCEVEFLIYRSIQQFCGRACANKYKRNNLANSDVNWMKDESDFKYYMLGLAYSDGCLSQQGNARKRYTLSLIDRNVIEEIRLRTTPDRKLYIRNMKSDNHNDMYSSVNINKDLIKALELSGICKNKTYNIKYPDIPLKYKSSFIRGFFDGDGSVYFNTVSGHRYTNVSFTCHDDKFLIRLGEDLTELGIKHTGKISKDKRGQAFYLRISSNKQALIFADVIYKNSSLHIQRKYMKFYGDIV